MHTVSNEPHIIRQSQFHEGVCLVPFGHIVQDKALHRQGLAMIRIPLQNGIGLFDCFLILLLLIVFHHIFEEITFFLRQWPALSSLWIVIGIVRWGHDCSSAANVLLREFNDAKFKMCGLVELFDCNSVESVGRGRNLDPGTTVFRSKQNWEDTVCW